MSSTTSLAQKQRTEKAKRRKETMQQALTSKDFYSPKKVLNCKGDINVIWGQRSNGKTYSYLKYALENYKKTGRTFVYVRRWAEDIVVKNMDKLMSPLPIKEIFGEDAFVRFFRGAFWLHREGETEEPECMGWSIALNQVAHTKSQTFINAQIVILDEFLQLSTERKLKDEFDAWEQTLSTILRTTQDAKIFILGNSIGQYSAYFTPYGIDPKTIKQGEVQEILLPNEDGTPTKVVAEYCEYNEKIGKRTSKYVRGSKMARTGEWETLPVANIPHTDNETAKEKLLCSMYDPVMNINLGIFLRTSRWDTLKSINGIYTTEHHERQFLVIRQTEKESHYYHLTTIKDLTYTRWSDLKLMLKDIEENCGIDVVNELKMGRVYTEDSFTGDYFYHTFMHYQTINTRDLL